MTKQEALKQMNNAINEMARMTEGGELYAKAKAKHDEAKKELIEMMIKNEEQKILEEVENAQQELEVVVCEIEQREKDLIAKAGVNSNSMIAGIASGTITTQTPTETQRIYELKKIIMSGGVAAANQARERSLARVKARNGITI